MKERPILFSTEMVRALLFRQKTQTRRTIKHPKRGILSGRHHLGYRLTEEGTALLNGPDYPDGPEDEIKCPYGHPGDLLWVRETWLRMPDNTFEFKASCSAFFEFDLLTGARQYKWKPSIHMPKEASRIWLQVTDLRVELLHEISEEDAKQEGITTPLINMHPDIQQFKTRNPNFRTGFAKLWIDINGPYSWKNNPWLWVIGFRILSTTGREDAYASLEKEGVS